MTTKTNANNNATYDLMAPEVRGNPHPIYARLRRETPLFKSTHYEMGGLPWILTRYQDSIDFLNDDRFTKSFDRRPGIDQDDMAMRAASAINRHMLSVDPPDHTRLRGLVHKAFTPRLMNELGGRIQIIADDLLDKVQGQPGMDLMKDFALPLPITVIAEMLGVPIEDQAQFRRWTQTIVMDGVKGTNPDLVATAAMEFIMYFHEMFDQRRANPKEDLISGLVQVEEAGDKLDSQELISMVFLLLVAGHETTVNLIGNGTLALLQNPDQMAKLRADPDLIRSGIEEMLRYDGPIGTSTPRWALEDIEMYGQTIAAGDMVVAALLAVNRDPEVFENPDTFDITRTPNKHIAFGNGIHYCLGAPLARIEGAIAINTLLRRQPNLSLAVPVADIQWNDTLLLHSMISLPVNF